MFGVWYTCGVWGMWCWILLLGLHPPPILCFSLYLPPSLSLTVVVDVAVVDAADVTVVDIAAVLITGVIIVVVEDEFILRFC